jgi:hypothetical protein
MNATHCRPPTTESLTDIPAATWLTKAATVLLAGGWLWGVALAEDFTSTQAEHALLENLAGDWHFERWVPAGEDNEPQKVGSGTVSAEMIGAFFVLSRWQGELMGFDFDGVQLLGYDIRLGKYSGAWGDAFMSYRWELGGSVDPDSGELILESSGPSPTGFEGTFRERYQFESAETIHVIGEVQQEDGWQEMTRTRLTRH